MAHSECLIISDHLLCRSLPLSLVRFWDTMSGRQLSMVKGQHTSTIYSAAVSSDGKFLATSSVS